MSGRSAVPLLALLVRHAHTDWVGRGLCGRQGGVALSAQGWREAQSLARRLREVPLTAVYSGPLERARHTAQAIADEHRLQVALSPALDEVDFGEWTGRALVELEQDGRWRRFNRERASAPVPGGESMAEVQARVVAELEGWRARHAGCVVAAVSHGDVLRAALLHYAGVSLDFYDRIEVAPASVSALSFDGGGARIVLLNDTGLLPGAPR